uniref:Ig-like domain-containing protein n=1 Tax=Rhodnius prolixus TaxID=13249 RepID=T1HBZ4_RHOPR
MSAYLEVVIPPDIIYEETSGDMMIPEGGSAKLVCKARGYPPPTITWRREDGGEIIIRLPVTGQKSKASVANKKLYELRVVLYKSKFSPQSVKTTKLDV